MSIGPYSLLCIGTRDLVYNTQVPTRLVATGYLKSLFSFVQKMIHSAQRIQYSYTDSQLYSYTDFYTAIQLYTAICLRYILSVKNEYTFNMNTHSHANRMTITVQIHAFIHASIKGFIKI